MRHLPLAFTFAFLSFAGCQSVHSSRQDGAPVVVWPAWFSVTGEGQRHGPQVDEAVEQVLKEAGLHAVVDERGVSVPDAEERRAREMLLTDKRLAGRHVLVILAVPAGSGRKTAAGFEVPEVAPEGLIQMPVTKASK